MSSAYGPRITFCNFGDGPPPIPDDNATVIGVVSVLSTTNVTENVVLHASIEITADADASGVALLIRRGVDITGDVVGIANYSTDTLATVQYTFAIDGIDAIGEGVQEQSYALIAAVGDASGESATAHAVFTATVF